MRKTLAIAVVCWAAAAAFAAARPGTQTQSKKPDADASATHTDVKMALVPLNVKTGLWQMTEKVAWENLPPQMAAMMQNAVPATYKSCVKQKDLIMNPWTNGSNEKCSWTVLSSTGADMEVQGKSCSFGKTAQGYQATADVHGKIHVVDSEHGTGSMTVTLNFNGQTMNGRADYTGKWVGATCPAYMNGDN